MNSISYTGNNATYPLEVLSLVCIGFGMAAGATVLKHLVDKSHQTKALVLT